MRPGWRRRVWSLGALVLLSLTGALVGQTYDLSVSYITPPGSPTVGVAGNFVVGESVPGGATGVTVTAVFTPAVTFNPYPASTLNCAANSAGGDPSITVTCPATGATSVTINVTPQTGGTLAVVAGIIGNENDPDMTYNSLNTSVTVAASSPTVTAITPRAGASAGAKSVTITGTNFQTGATVTIGGTAATNVNVTPTQITATTPSHAAGVGSVVVTNPGGGAGTLTPGYTFMAATVFSEDPLTQFVSAVKAQHILDLRNAVANLWSVAGIPGSPTWTNTVAVGVTIRATDVQEIRPQLNQALTALGYGAGSYTDDPLQSQVTLIKKVHIDQLRSGVKQVTN